MFKNKLKDRRKDIFVVLFYLIIPFLFYFNIFYSKGFLAPGDGIVSYVPLRSFLVESFSQLHFPFWNSNLVLGTPFLADIQSTVFYPPNFLYMIFPFEFAYNYSFLFHLSLAGIFTYFYLRSINLSRKAAFIGGIAFMFSACINARKGHITIQNAIVWLPLILYFYEKLISSRKKIFLILMAISFSVQIFAGFIQITLYISIVLLIYFIFSIKRYYNWKKWLFDKVNFAVIAIGFSLIQLIPTLLITRNAGRQTISYEYFSSFSLPLKSLLTLFFPYFYGTDTPNVPFSLYTNGSLLNDGITGFGIYAGIIPTIMAIWICIYGIKRKNRLILSWFFIGLVSLTLSLGSSIPFLNEFMFKIPLFNMFRVSARFIFAFNFSIAVLFAIQINYILQNIKEIEKIRKYVMYVTLLVVGAVILTINVIKVVVSSLANVNNNEIINHILLNYNLKNPAIYIPIVIFAFYNIYCFIYKKIRKKNVLHITFVLILLFDLHSYSFYYANIFVQAGNETIAQNIKNRISDTERIWTVFERYGESGVYKGVLPNRNMHHGIKSINGYVTFLSDEYKQITGFDESGASSKTSLLLDNNYIISMLNTKYIILDNKNKHMVEKSKILDFDSATTVFELTNIDIEYNKSSGYGITQEKISVDPNTYYRLNLKLNKSQSKANIYVDLYGENYDSNAQQLNTYNTDGSHFSKVINTGSNIPAEVYLRIVSLSDENVNVEYASLEQINSMENASPYKEIYQDEIYSIYENRNSLDKFYSVQNIMKSNNLFNSIYETNLYTTAIVDNHPGSSELSQPSLELVQYVDGYGSVKVDSPGSSSFVVFSEQYFPGWKAYIDGKETKIYKVNGLIQGVDVPSGYHVVEFKYKPSEFSISIAIFLLTLVYSVLYLMKDKILINRRLS